MGQEIGRRSWERWVRRGARGKALVKGKEVREVEKKAGKGR